MDFNGQINYSEILSIEFKRDEELILFPNPFNNTFEIRGIDFYQTKIKIMDNTGRIIFEEEITKNEAHVSNLPSGLYTIIIETEKEFYVKRIIKNAKL